jgi:L-fuculose-phosphate aldolase
MDFSMLHPTEQLSRMMKRIYDHHLTTTSGGNLSLIDDDGIIWITPSGIDKGNLTPDDIICVKPDGEVCGKHKPSMEYPFHSTIYKKRPDIRAIVHTHAPALVAYSIAREIPSPLTTPYTADNCGNIRFALYARPGSEALGMNISNEFSNGADVVIMENHGAVAGGKDLMAAFHRLEMMEFNARTLIRAKTIGDLKSISDNHLAAYRQKLNQVGASSRGKISTDEKVARREVVEMTHRAYRQKFITGIVGSVSARIDDQAFVITPHNVDRSLVSREDLVWVSGEQIEQGKIPDITMAAHRQIYTKHPEVNSIITGISPNIMAYSYSHQDFDTKVIPETYIMLREISNANGLDVYQNPDKIAELISRETPVILVKNDFVLVTGTSTLQAFDRLEVAEFSAGSLIDTHHIGKFVPINQEAIEEIINSFLK